MFVNVSALPVRGAQSLVSKCTMSVSSINNHHAARCLFSDVAVLMVCLHRTRNAKKAEHGTQSCPEARRSVGGGGE